MPQQATCAGQCGRSVYLSKGSLPAGQATCRGCRSSRSSVMVYLTCGYCGEEFMRKRAGTRQGAKPFCSVACRNLGIHEGKLSRHRLCEVCETPYYASYTEQRTCGRVCGGVIYQRRAERQTWPSCKVYAGYCRQCGEAFTSRTPLRITCSRRCSDRLYNSTARPPACRCADCGDSIPADRRKCDACLARSRTDARRRDKHRRRALKRGVASERYTLTEIAKRDRFRCGICRERVDMALKGPHVMCPSVDHVLPLACGGDDTRANVQLAHWLCNVAKRDQGGGEQLALVG
jgi:hypothetical protein